MTTPKLGPNDRCPCGSGKKVKKCCKLQRTVVHYTAQDRTALFAEFDSFIDEHLRQEEEDAYDAFWGSFLGREDELPPELLPLSEDVQFMEFVCDHELAPGVTAIDMLLDREPSLSLGARAFARVIRGSTMRLYEATEMVPGVSITLRDVLEGGSVTVAERTASRSLNQFDWLAARVVDRGPSGQPEMERGVLAIPRLYHQSLEARLGQLRAAAQSEGRLAAFYAQLPALFHEVWAGSALEPHLPALHNTDGDPLLITRVHFDVLDRSGLERALDQHASLSREGGRWSWSGPNQHGKVVSLGSFTLVGSSLILEANSKARAERGSQLLKELAPSAVVQGATTYEDLEPSLREGVRARVRDSSAPAAARATERPEIPPEIAEALVLDHYARHYRAWVDEPIPALEGVTPRAAAKRPALRAQLVQLIQGLESMYQQALRQGAPAYDPSWMWGELGLKVEEPRLPPPLPHERLAQFIEGAEQLIVEVAEAQRRAPGFDDSSSLLDRDACRRLLDVQRFVRAHEPAADAAASPAWRRRALMPYLELALNFALHRRKVFWVDEALTYMLAHTDSEMPANDLRAPFSSLALVFTDRHVLSLAERLLSKRAGSALAGLILRVATVYVSEWWHDTGRTLELCFAFDALGDDLPELVHHTLSWTGDVSVQTLLPQDEAAELSLEVKPVTPLRGLLQVVVNALLYATSHGVEPELRSGTPPGAAHVKKTPERVCTSESVYFLPGTIDIRQVRTLQALSRVAEGREALRRCMVRGHWRRAAENWSDKRLRWIAPYWKGPDMAAVIERAYRLKP